MANDHYHWMDETARYGFTNPISGSEQDYHRWIEGVIEERYNWRCLFATSDLVIGVDPSDGHRILIIWRD